MAYVLFLLNAAKVFRSILAQKTYSNFVRLWLFVCIIGVLSDRRQIHDSRPINLRGV